ncbi:MAG: carbon-nitrogen hydrolase family protein [Bacillota bacterium]
MELKIGICQLKVGGDKQANLARAGDMIRRAAVEGADLVVLPEMFNCPYQQDYFPKFAETEADGESVRFLADAAGQNHCYLVGGSLPERDGDRLYNTSFVFDREGLVIAKHRKAHLFDVDIPGGITFKESAVLSAGNQATVFKTEFGRCGLMICYDLRFPELFRLLLKDDIKLVFVPAAFNMTTGPAHWDLLFRTRAVDNQVFVIGASPARDNTASYVAYGHSLAVDPFGRIIWQAGAEEIIGIVTLDLDLVEKVRRELPLLKHRRADLYPV